MRRPNGVPAATTAVPHTKHPEIWGLLAKPFRPEHVKVKVIAGRQMQYITARTVMNRLDYAVGPENWWDDYERGDESVLCRLTIRLPDGQCITKCDAGGYAGMSDPGDDDKSGYSDAFKRAAVKFGIGRHLYGDGVLTYPSDVTKPPEVLPVEPSPSHEPPTQAPRGECSAWIQARVDEIEAEWAMMCAKEKKPHEKLGLNPWRVINGVITDWVARGVIEPQSVLTDGKRDKSKVMEMIRNDWDASDGEELKQDVIAYLRDKLETAAKVAGINLDAEPEEVTADA